MAPASQRRTASVSHRVFGGADCSGWPCGKSHVVVGRARVACEPCASHADCFRLHPALSRRWLVKRWA
eukprot:14539385-Alexandrium_andersonii.AAC.1